MEQPYFTWNNLTLRGTTLRHTHTHHDRGGQGRQEIRNSTFWRKIEIHIDETHTAHQTTRHTDMRARHTYTATNSRISTHTLIIVTDMHVQGAPRVNRLSNGLSNGLSDCLSDATPRHSSDAPPPSDALFAAHRLLSRRLSVFLSVSLSEVSHVSSRRSSTAAERDEHAW